MKEGKTRRKIISYLKLENYLKGSISGNKHDISEEHNRPPQTSLKTFKIRIQRVSTIRLSLCRRCRARHVHQLVQLLVHRRQLRRKRKIRIGMGKRARTSRVGRLRVERKDEG